MNNKLFKGEVEVNVRYEISDGHLWLAAYDVERAVYGYGNGSVYCYAKSEKEKYLTSSYRRRLVGISENNAKNFCEHNKHISKDFLLWLEELIEEHKDEIKESASQQEPVNVVVNNVVPLVRTEGNNENYIAEDILINAYFGNTLPAEVKEMVKNFLVNVKTTLRNVG